MTSALMPLANGVEEMEAVMVLDTLRRARWDARGVAIADPTILGSREVRLLADARWDDITPSAFDVLVIPGGREGARALSADRRVLDTVRAFAETGKLIGAICAGPLVLQAAGILAGRKATCHPAVRAELTAPAWIDARVVTDGRLLTSQGPGTALEFALALIAAVDGAPAAAAVRGPLMLPP